MHTTRTTPGPIDPPISSSTCRPRRRGRRAATLCAALLAIAACSDDDVGRSDPPSDTAAPPGSPASTAAPTTNAPAPADTVAPGDTVAPVDAATVSLDAAAIAADQLVEHWVAYVGAAVATGEPDPDRAASIAALYDPALASVDTAALGRCVLDELDSIRDRGGRGIWEHSSWRDHGERFGRDGDPTTTPVVAITMLDNLVAGSFDDSLFVTFVAGAGGFVGQAIDPNGAVQAGLVGCLDGAVASSAEASASLELAVDGTVLASIDGSGLDGAASFTNAATSGGDAAGPDGGGPDGGASDGGDVWARREGLPADPDDPEPIASTGSNQWDLITADDPTAFVCVDSLGQGPEEILRADKSGYERVPDAYLYIARFGDGTTIDLRVHPEIGSQADADAEIERYLDPLGRLPTLLRRDIGRFAVRVGDNTATASPGEGMMLQTGNATIRIADDRLEETLFHEAVHTSLDATWSYQRSQDWLDAQTADGRWLTEYGRENPDSEDLAETALYGYALARHPERFPDGVAAAIAARVPNRLAIIDTIFPVDEPAIATSDQTVSCSG